MCGIVNRNLAKMECKYTYKGFINFNVPIDLLAKEHHRQDKMHGLWYIFVNLMKMQSP